MRVRRCTGLALYSLVVLAGCRAGSGAQAPSSHDLFVPSEARDVRHEKRPGFGAGVSYTVEAAYPADGFIKGLQAHFQSPGWKPLDYDWLNPDIPSSHRRGWTTFVDASKTPQTRVHSWSAQWSNAAGDIATYAMTYESPVEAGELHRPPTAARPTESRMNVTGSVIPHASAAAIVRQAAQVQARHEKTKSSESRSGPLVARLEVTPSPDEQIELQTITGGDGVSHVFSVARSVVEETPDWEPEKGPAPLSLADAIAAAKATVAARHPKFGGFKVMSLSLHGIHCYPPIPGKWYYVITFSPVVAGQTAVESGMWGVVLMDGTVVEPKREARGSTP